MRNLLIILFSVFSLASNAQQLLDKVIAVVGKYPLLLSDLEVYQMERLKEDPKAVKSKAFEELLYSKLLLPERDNTANIKRLATLVRDENVVNKINQAAEKNNPTSSDEMMNTDMMSFKGKNSNEKAVLGKKSKPYTMQSLVGNNSMVAQVTGIIIGSPEFQRK